MATTYIEYDGTTTPAVDGINTDFTFPFPYLKIEDVRASINGVGSSAFTINPATPTLLEFTAAPTAGATVRIYRQTDPDATPATFFAGSSVRAKDLNDNFDQILFIMQERQEFLQDLQLGQLPQGGLGTAALQDDAVDSTKLRDDVSNDGNRAVTTNHIRDNAVTSAKLDTNIDIAGTFDVTGNATFDSNVDIASTGYLKVPSGDTTARNALTPVNGMIRYNTTDSRLEAYVNGSWGEVSRAAGAVGGGGDTVFVETSQLITTDYTLTTGATIEQKKNAMSAGPVTIDTGVTVTVPAGQSWVIV